MIKTVSLRDITTKIGSGATPRGGANSYLSTGPFALIRSQNIRDEGFEYKGLVYIDDAQADKLKNVEVQSDDVLINITGDSVARIGLVPAQILPARVNQHVAILRPDSKKIDPRYLYYSLIVPHMKHNLLSMASIGATRNALTKIQLEKLKLNIVELGEQNKIADILGTIDEKIEINRKMNETLEQMGQALFRHYFINNPDAFGWRKRELGEFFPVKTGKKDANFGTPDGEYPFFTCAQTITRAPAYSFNGHALLLAGNGDFNIKLYRGRFEAYQRTYVLIPNDERMVGVLYFLMSIKLPEITGGSRGSVIKFITKGMIENYKHALPEDAELIKIANIFNQITINIEENFRQNQNLINLRDTLLPRLISGKIHL